MVSVTFCLTKKFLVVMPWLATMLWWRIPMDKPRCIYFVHCNFREQILFWILCHSGILYHVRACSEWKGLAIIWLVENCLTIFHAGLNSSVSLVNVVHVSLLPWMHLFTYYTTWFLHSNHHVTALDIVEWFPICWCFMLC